MSSLYRKYRPKSLAQVSGHNMVTTILKNAAGKNKLGHAYLLYGQRGTGKTSTARILAKLVNCERRQIDEKFREEGEPCNECRACREIDLGRAVDVVEIDAASNRGIDEIRNLQEGIRLAPTFLQKKVFIIDEVHMLTAPAFNALLKTLEEPPPHVMFVLATTELDKVPLTIISRTQKFVFKKLPQGIIKEKLEMVAKAEELKISGEVLGLIAAAADGSFRDAETLLDQVISLLGTKKEITLEETEMAIGKTSNKKIAEVVRAILSQDIEATLVKVEEIKELGMDIIEFNKDLIRYLGKLMALKANVKMEAIYKKEMTDLELKEMIEIAKESKLADQIKLTKLLIEAHREMRYSPFALVPFQVAVILAVGASQNHLE